MTLWLIIVSCVLLEHAQGFIARRRQRKSKTKLNRLFAKVAQNFQVIVLF